ncbi:MAG: transporter substrate-binding domain-containing protein, partial [Microcystaceae cyanobacterium]
MYKKLSLALLSLAFILALPRPSLAETVMEKVERTGTLTAGTRTDIVPYSYVNDKGELVGYSIDVLNLIKEELQTRLGKPIQLELVAVDVEDRIPKIENRDVDIVCEDVAFTWQREQFVDFSLSYSVDGVKLIAKKGGNLGSPESLKGKRIGINPNT